MLITSRSRIENLDLDRPWLCAKEKLAINQVLAIIRDEKPETLAVRHVSETNIGWTTPHAPENLLAICVATKARGSFDVFNDEKHLRRPATRPGALTIRDFRIPAYADLREHTVDNTVVFIPWSAMASLADDLRVPKIEAVRTLFEEDHVDDSVLNLVEVIKLALERPVEANIYFLEHVFGAMRVHIATTYGGMGQPILRRRGGLTPLQERRIKDQIIGRLAEPPSLSELAASCGLSTSHFSRAFKDTTGFPPHQWLLAERVKRAKDLLQKTKTPITEVALHCGFADQSHMTRVFSKSAGISPAIWRRNAKG